MFRRRFINFSLRRLREKLQNVPQFEMDFVLNFAEFCHVLSRCHLRERTFNKHFQETASLSIVLSLSIHKISSKHDRDYNI